MQPKVSVVLVNYNGNKFLEECIISLKHQTYKNCSIILVDNCSTDCSLDIFKNHEEVFLIKLKNNIGFAGGCNIGIRAALRQKADYILLLNTDTVAEPDLIEKLLKYANKNTVTTAKIYSDKYKKKIWYAAGCMDFDKGCSYNISRQKNNLQKNKYITFISGCCMMIHKNIWSTVGLLDENYFMYYEDDDLCMRFIQNNIKMLYLPNASLWHRVGGSGKNVGNGFKTYYMTRNRLSFIKKFRKNLNTSIVAAMCEELLDCIFDSSNTDTQIRKSVLFGIRDFLIGRMGKRKYQ